MKKLTSLWLTLLVSLASLTGCSADEATSLGIIGGADGPTQVLVTGQTENNTDHTTPTETAPPAENDSAPTETEQTENTDNSSQPEESFGPAVTGSEIIKADKLVIEEEGWYTSREEVALYLMKYDTLPGNYITKKEAQALGWEGGSLNAIAPGKSIGGDHFGNYEGALPEKNGRSYSECDIDANEKGRGAKRLVFSNDGLIFYTEDHYETFTLLTGG